MCPQSYDACGRKKGFMTTQLFEKIIDDISSDERTKDGIVGFHITGEPTLHKDIHHFIKYTTDRGMKIRLNTNATKLNGEMSLGLIKNGLQEIVFSFEGFSKEDYERIRVGANYESVLENIHNFIKLNDIHGHPVHTELFVVKIPGVAENKIQRFIDEMSNQIDTINVVGCMDWAGQIEEFKNKYPIRLGYKDKCTAFETDLNILYNGLVVPCCLDSSGVMAFGDFNIETLNDILKSSDRRYLINKIGEHNLKGLLCENCSSILSRNTLIINNLLDPKRLKKHVRNLLHSIKRKIV